MYLSRSVSYKVEDTDICYILTGLQLKGKKKKPRFSKKLRCNFRLPVTVCHMIIFRVSHLCCILFKLTGRRYISFVLLNWDLNIVIVKLYLHKLPFQKAFMIKRFTERRFFLVLSLFTDRQGYAGWQIVLLSSRLLLPTAAAWALPSFYLCKFVLLRWRWLKSHSIPELIKNMYQCGYVMTLTYETRKKFHLSKAYL